DSPADVLEILAGTAARALRDAVAEIDIDAVDRAATVISRAERVHLYGEWVDSVALRELQMRLQRIGVAAWFLEGGSATRRAVCNTLTDQDAVVVLNRSGTDELATRLLRGARGNGAAALAVHGPPGPPDAPKADMSLVPGR